ncbi:MULTISPECIES: cytochrome c biogenesis CcdA family protein [Bacillaceae]|uniref:Cytochrome C biogenesis protein CcdA n=3 Tax=Bacillales TaxID=1385 RepID=A0ABR5MG62_9BACI|nr:MULTISPECIES: cytochrome c biogenesis protein CcdA [Bacillaceae]KPH71459.1 cytochrome C biogenesis protein CcdA [Oceanobacillus caeni]MBU8791379.1 cytochrome c biogenesis protein CcdA [Oceanobacillus caeni]MDA3129862.1 cytochrome C biogenesis protein CcdA [Aliibacillus thermotolerans]MED4475467.1 cytochrome c biogenesis protein CcdA [Oceanobacillus caeni]
MGIIETDTMLLVGMLLAIGAGALSFLSPCVLPIFPAYMSYITGISVKELQGNKNRKIVRQLFAHSFFFLLAVSLVFLSLGASASFLGQWAQKLLVGDSGLLIQRIAGVFIIIMGLFIAGWIQIPSLMKERRFHYTKKPAGYVGTFFIGLGFAAGWTPCIGPIFGSILLLAASNPGQGMFYTIMYVFGFALPFLVLTFFIGKTKWIVRHSNIIMKIGAIMMILMGFVLFFGLMPRISGFLLDLVQDTWLSRLG